MDRKQKETKLIHSIADEFGQDKKPVLMQKIKSLLKNQREMFIKQVEINLNNLD